VTHLDHNHAELLAALTRFAEDVNAANDRYMNGDVSGVTLSIDIHAAAQRLSGQEPTEPGPWTLKPGDVVPESFPSSIDDRTEAASALDDAPMGTFLRDCDGDNWRRVPKSVWALNGGSVERDSLWLVSTAEPLTVVSVPHVRKSA
jgi:hypothetical protein